MEDSFKVRVDRAFGSLEASSSSTIKSTSSSLNSLWCLTDEEIERNEWIQDKITSHEDTDEKHIHRLKTPKPYSSFLQGLLAEPSTSNQDLESDIQELDDEEEEDDQQPPLSKPDDHSNDDWNIRSSVGMDCTLDNEEEEDRFDKVALGKEDPADRFYMKDVNDYEVEIDSNNELPTSLTEVIKDPRANHMAAKLRLKEDEESARKLGLQVSENNIQESITTENQITTQVVPDYVRNPSKYTHYTFDSMDDVDEESNRKAYMELFNMLKGSGGGGMETEDVPFDSSMPIVFTPRKKLNDGLMKKSKEDGAKKVVPVGIAAEDVEVNGVCMMDEDEPEIANNKGSSLQRGGRRYRTKGSADVE